jgi:hypothetical protein
MDITWQGSLVSGATWAAQGNARNAFSAARLTYSGNLVRVKFVSRSLSSGFAPLRVVGASIGERSGTTKNFVDTPTRLTFDSGSSIFQINWNETKWSDWVTFNLDKTKNYLIHFCVTRSYSNSNSSGVNIIQSDSNYYCYWNDSTTDDTMVVTPGESYSEDIHDFGIGEIDVDSTVGSSLGLFFGNG